MNDTSQENKTILGEVDWENINLSRLDQISICAYVFMYIKNNLHLYCGQSVSSL